MEFTLEQNNRNGKWMRTPPPAGIYIVYWEYYMNFIIIMATNHFISLSSSVVISQVFQAHVIMFNACHLFVLLSAPKLPPALFGNELLEF